MCDGLAINHVGLLLMVMKLSLMIVLLVSLCEPSFAGDHILRVLTRFVKHSSSEDDDFWQRSLEIKHILGFDNIKLEALYYKGNTWNIS